MTCICRIDESEWTTRLVDRIINVQSMPLSAFHPTGGVPAVEKGHQGILDLSWCAGAPVRRCAGAPLRLTGATGRCDWPVRLAGATGRCDWPVRLAGGRGRLCARTEGGPAGPAGQVSALWARCVPCGPSECPAAGWSRPAGEGLQLGRSSRLGRGCYRILDAGMPEARSAPRMGEARRGTDPQRGAECRPRRRHRPLTDRRTRGGDSKSGAPIQPPH